MESVAGTALLGADQVEQFGRDGFVVIDDACSPDLVEAVVRLLESRRSDGARFLVVPKPSLGWLQLAQPRLQEWLKTPDRGVLRDGSICAIYSLE
jgi:hypothetical protein